MPGIELKTDFGDQIELGFEKIDVFFFVVHEFLEQVVVT